MGRRSYADEINRHRDRDRDRGRDRDRDYDDRDDYDRRRDRGGRSRERGMSVPEAFELLFEKVEHLDHILTNHENTFREIFGGRYDGTEKGLLRASKILLSYLADEMDKGEPRPEGEDMDRNEGRRRRFSEFSDPLAALAPANNNNRNNESDNQSEQFKETAMSIALNQVLNVPKESPFSSNSDVWIQLLRNSRDLYVRLDQAIATVDEFAYLSTPENMDMLHDVVNPAKEGRQSIHGVSGVFLYKNITYSISREIAEKTLCTTPESLHYVLGRTMRDATDVDDMLFLDALDRNLANKVNEYLKLELRTDTSIDSYAGDLEELRFAIRDEFSSEVLERMNDRIVKIVETNITNAYSSFLADELDMIVKIPLLEVRSALISARYSKFLGLDEVPADEYIELNMSDSNNAIVKDVITTLAGSRKDLYDENETYLVTRDNKVYKIVRTRDNSTFIKRFNEVV